IGELQPGLAQLEDRVGPEAALGVPWTVGSLDEQAVRTEHRASPSPGAARPSPAALEFYDRMRGVLHVHAGCARDLAAAAASDGHIDDVPDQVQAPGAGVRPDEIGRDHAILA